MNMQLIVMQLICKSIKNLIALRLKMKSNENNTQTNADNLQHISSTQSSLKYLLCSEIQNNEKNCETQNYFLNLLENTYDLLVDIKIDADLFQPKITSLRKQLY